MINKRLFCTTDLNLFKRKSSHNDIFRKLPRVPTTQFLESRELTRDILFSGYRPIMYPVKENPLFGGRNRNGGITSTAESVKILSQIETRAEQPEHTVMSGPRGCGGIKSGGVNGAWRYGPRLPNKLLPYDLWSTTTMGMEYFPEWLNVPRQVVRKLRPFDGESATFQRKLQKK